MKRIIFLIWMVFSLSGCVVVTGKMQRLPAPRRGPVITASVERIVGPKHRASQWKYITLHHSATFEGNAECFDNNHRSRNMGGLFYHFVIGNGSRSGDGEIEVGWRWKEQKEANRPNDIQICLVGNFCKEFVSGAQFDSLLKLINVLRKQYNILAVNVRRHQDAVDTFTECPGDNFPFYKLLTEVTRFDR